MTKPIHSMIRVLDEARSVTFYRTAFGLEIADRFAFEGFTLVYLRSPEDDFELELTINHGRAEPYAPGDGYGHIAFVVADVAAERTRMAATGLTPEPVKEFHREGALMARFFFITDPDGYRIEVLERHGRYR
ncbi:MAG: lactoylglutathione lyase [Rhodospirillales bacterium 70-18]|nr:VOC family protein [Rhodospirillales bacterium]OJY76518.1 MAG: lactoylglutathione lyase [Rhodospirillales bacterium 70-18]